MPAAISTRSRRCCGERARSHRSRRCATGQRGTRCSGHAMSPTNEVLDFVLMSLPPPAARVLEVGAGSGELAGFLREQRYDVVAIDPASSSPGVEAIALHEFNAPPRSFDA